MRRFMIPHHHNKTLYGKYISYQRKINYAHAYTRKDFCFDDLFFFTESDRINNMSVIENNFPKILDPVVGQTTLTDAHRDEQRLVDKKISDLTFDQVDLSGLFFNGCVLDHCKFIGCNLSRASFVNTILNTCDFSNSDLTEAYFSNCKINQSKFMGAALINSVIKNVIIDDSNFRYAVLDQTKFNDLDISQSDFTYTEINECRLKYTTLDTVDFSHASFFKTRLGDLNFTRCTIDGIRVSNDLSELRGMQVSISQAADLSRLMGIVIQDSSDN